VTYSLCQQNTYIHVESDQMYVYAIVNSIISPIQICGIKDVEHAVVHNREVRTRDSNLTSVLGLSFVNVELRISDLAGCSQLFRNRSCKERTSKRTIKGTEYGQIQKSGGAATGLYLMNSNYQINAKISAYGTQLEHVHLP